MGYYIRFIVADDQNFALEPIEAGLKSIDPLFKLTEWDHDIECAELVRGNDLYGEIELYRIDQNNTDEEIKELIEEVEDAHSRDKVEVLHFLHNAKAMLVIRILWQNREIKTTMDTIAPLWNWLFDTYQGLLQADGEGYYDQEGQILLLPKK